VLPSLYLRFGRRRRESGPELVNPEGSH
jgi:hypothetical protein